MSADEHDDHHADRMALLWLTVWLGESPERRAHTEWRAALMIKRLHAAAHPVHVGQAIVRWSEKRGIVLTDDRVRSLQSVGAQIHRPPERRRRARR